MKELKIKMREQLFIKKMTKIFLFIFIALFFASCQFNITDIPGPQISTTIESSKKHNTFICKFKTSNNMINGQKVETIFAEKRYLLNQGVLGKFSINCCKSQLVVNFKDSSNLETIDGVFQNWEIIDFKLIHSNLLVRYFDGILFPDSIPIFIIPNTKKKEIIEKCMLYRINE